MPTQEGQPIPLRRSLTPDFGAVVLVETARLVPYNNQGQARIFRYLELAYPEWNMTQEDRVTAVEIARPTFRANAVAESLATELRKPTPMNPAERSPMTVVARADQELQRMSTYFGLITLQREKYTGGQMRYLDEQQIDGIVFANMDETVRGIKEDLLRRFPDQYTDFIEENILPAMDPALNFLRAPDSNNDLT